MGKIKISCFEDIQLFHDNFFVFTKNAHMVGVTIIFVNNIFAVCQFLRKRKIIPCENLDLCDSTVAIHTGKYSLQTF